MLATLPLDITATVVAMVGTSNVGRLINAGAPMSDPALARRVAETKTIDWLTFQITRFDDPVSLALQTLEWFVVTQAECVTANFPEEMNPDVVRRCISYDPESVVRAHFTPYTTVLWLLWAARRHHEEWFVSAVCARLVGAHRMWDVLLDAFGVAAYSTDDVFRICMEFITHLPVAPGERHVAWFSDRSPSLGMLLRAAHNVHAGDDPGALVDTGVDSITLLEAVAVAAPRTPRDLTDIVASLRFECEQEAREDVDAQQQAIRDYYESQQRPVPEAKRPCYKTAEPDDAHALSELNFVLLPDQETWLDGWFAPQVHFDGAAIRCEQLGAPLHRPHKRLFCVDGDGVVTLLCEAPRAVIEDARAAFVAGEQAQGRTPSLGIKTPPVALVVAGVGGVESVTFF